MPTTRVLATALPRSLAPQGPHVTAFVTLKLDPGAADGLLSDFPAAQAWSDTLTSGSWELVTDAVAQPLPLTAVSAPTPGAWGKVFPGDTRVAGYPAPAVADAPWTSFPASRLPDHAVDLHLASLTAAPTRRPGVLTNPAVAPVLDRLARASDSIQLLRNLAAERATRPDRLLARRLADVQASLGQGRRVEGQPLGPSRNGLEVLFDDEGADERTTAMLDAQLGQDLSGDPAARALVDAHAARRYYDRPEEQVPYQESPTPGAATPRPANDQPDFHQRAASLGDTPALLRAVGLVVDLALAPGDRAQLANATWVAVRFVPAQGADVTRVAPPRTRVTVSGQAFEAVSSNAWVHGAVPLGRETYVLLDLDPDASGLKLDQHLRSLPRLAASEVNGDDSSSAPGSLRSSGFAIARTDRVDALRERVQAAEAMASPDDGPGVAGPTLTYDDVVRGLRLEVWDDRTKAWHSLHERLVTVRTDPGGDVLVDQPDTGFLQGSSLNRVPGNPANPYYAHEVVAGWDGWSLSAPRPGLVIEHQSDGSEKPVEQVSDEPASGVRVTSRVAAGTLPRLRWGWQYAFRLVGVDLAGDSVPRPAGPRAPGRAAVQAAAAHLAAVGRAYRSRDRASLLTAVRRQVLAALPDPDDGSGTAGWASEPPVARGRRAPGDGTPASGLRTRRQKIDAFVPAAVRTGDTAVDAALADRIATGAADRVASPVSAAFEQVAKATRALGTAADGLRVRPQVTVPPAELVPVLGGDDPDVVTVPRPYLRWAPVPPPTLVAAAPLTTGEQLSRLVIRSGLPAGNPDAVESTARHVLPPKTTQLDAETAGLFDAAIGSADPSDHAAALPVALAERGTLLDEVIQDLGDANAGRTQPDVSLASRPGADPAQAVTLAQITANRDTPLGEGQYVVHAVEELVLPYLPDPHAAGVALVFYDAGVEHTLAEPRALQAVVLPFGVEEPGWPRLQPLRLLLTAGPSLGATLEGRTVRVTLPPGEQVRVAMSSSLRPSDLAVFGLWRSQPAAAVDPGTATPAQVAAAAVLARAAAAGWTWWLTPSTDLRLVHAVPTPVVPPALLGLRPLPRPRDLTVAPLVGLVDLHGASTERLVVRGDWQEWVDDVASAGPQRVSRSGVLTDSPVGGTERFGLLWLVDFQPFGLSATSASLADGDIGLHKAIATFPDTHHRVVAYTPTGTTRYAEMFAPGDLPAPDDPALAGAPVTVDVPSSARPAGAEVLDAVPLLRWTTQTEPEQPFALRRVRRSGVRVWLARPWYSSGDGELLGVVLGTGTGAPAGTVSLWGRDPISSSPAITAGERPPLLEAAHVLVEGLSGVVVPRTARPVTGAVPVPLVDANDAPALVFGYQPEYDERTGRWFVDVALEDTPQLWPFVRLAVARYQPSSIPGCELSPVALTSWVQPLPTRTATVSRPDADHVRVTVTGTVSFLRTVRQAGDTEVVDADTPTGALALVDALVSATRTVTASLQRLPDGGSDLQWETVATRRLPVVGVQGATYRVTWSAALALPDEHGLPLATPGASGRWRVLVDEAELLDADAPGIANVKDQTVRVPRTVYLDTIAL